MQLNVSQVKAIAAACLFIAAIIGGLLPFLLKQRSLNNARRKAEEADHALSLIHI